MCGIPVLLYHTHSSAEPSVFVASFSVIYVQNKKNRECYSIASTGGVTLSCTKKSILGEEEKGKKEGVGEMPLSDTPYYARNTHRPKWPGPDLFRAISMQIDHKSKKISGGCAPCDPPK